MRYWGVVPAAGSGTRMNNACPKQYLKIHGHYVLDYCLSALLSYPKVQKVMVSLEPDTAYWNSSAFSHHDRILMCDGGASRMQSVLNALRGLAELADDTDWILVHDAVRPCLAHAEVRRLIETLRDDAIGGILASPLVDTVKRVDETESVVESFDRGCLYRGLTPQMFRYRPLFEALNQAADCGKQATDEAQAMEWAGHQVRVVVSQAVNIKITHPGDLDFASFHLSGQPVEMLAPLAGIE